MERITSKNIEELIKFSIASLERMVLNTKLFCNQIKKGKAGAEGISIRYSIMTLIGLYKAKRGGYKIPFDLDSMSKAVFDNVDSSDLRPGDMGLFLWLDSKSGAQYTDKLIKYLENKIKNANGYSVLEGQEVAWIILGLAHAYQYNNSSQIRELLKDSLDQLLDQNRARGALFYHYGQNNIRRRFPNFATQIYAIFALAIVSSLELDKRAINAAKEAAEVLVHLQLSDFGWPWIFDVERNKVVEPYEVYSVHQDAMAPMALLTLSEVTGDVKYKKAAINGLYWIYGQNIMNYNMIDNNEGMIYRSIRRKNPFNKLILYSNTLSCKLSNYSFNFKNSFIEINQTCRPYHLGWLLEAWVGRENI